jgi:hypothetical protein
VIGRVEQHVGAEELGHVRLARQGQLLDAGVEVRCGAVYEQLRCLNARVQTRERMLD